MASQEELDGLLSDKTGRLQPKPHRGSLVILSLVNLLMNIDTTVILPTLWFYLLSKDPEVSTSTLGWILAVFSAGGFFSAPLLGWFADAVSMKIGIVISLLILAGGNVMYAMAPSVDLVLVARLIAGLASGNIVLGFTYISSAVPGAQRTSEMGTFRGIGLLGMIAAPGLGATLLYVHFHLGGKVIVDQYTVPGFLVAALSILFIPFVIIFFKDLPRRKKSEKEKVAKPHKAKVSGSTWGRLSFLLFLSFWQYFVISAFNSTTAPITQSQWDWTPLQNAILYLVMGLMVLISTMLVRALSKKLDDITLLTLGSLLLLIGLVCCGQYRVALRIEQIMFCVAALASVLGLSSGMTTVPSLYSKWLTNIANKGKMMSFIPMFGGLGRIVGPIFAGYGLKTGNRNIVFFTQAGVTLVLMLLSIFGKKWLTPNLPPPSPSSEKGIN